LRTKPLTIGAAENLLRDVQQDLLSGDLFEIDAVAVEDIGVEVVYLNFMVLFRGEVLSLDKADLEIDRHRSIYRLQTSCTVDLGLSRDRTPYLDLSCPPDGLTLHLKTSRQSKPGLIKRHFICLDRKIERPGTSLNLSHFDPVLA